MFISENPADENELAFASYENHVYVSDDDGGNWK